MVCSDGAPQVSKPVRAPADVGGGEEEGPGLTGWVGNPVPVGVGTGQDGGIQEGGVGKPGGGCEATGEGPGVAVAPDGDEATGVAVAPDGDEATGVVVAPDGDEATGEAVASNGCWPE